MAQAVQGVTHADNATLLQPIAESTPSAPPLKLPTETTKRTMADMAALSREEALAEVAKWINQMEETNRSIPGF